MTALEARNIVLDVLDEHLDERARARSRLHTEAQREAGRAAMADLMTRRGVDFAKLAASGLSAYDIAANVRALVRRGLS